MVFVDEVSSAECKNGPRIIVPFASSLEGSSLRLIFSDGLVEIMLLFRVLSSELQREHIREKKKQHCV